MPNANSTNLSSKKRVQVSKAPSLRVQRKSSTLREKATDILRQAIVDHRFPPGSHLIERELCEMLDVSRTSVREALRHLESEHLIKMVPHKGPIVASLTIHDAEDLYQVRASLDGLAGELFVLRASDAQLKNLRDAATNIARLSNREPQFILDAVAEFYQIIFDGAQNPVCAQFIKSLNTRIAFLRRISLASIGRWEAMLQELECIVPAAETRNAEAMRQASVAHIEVAYQAVLPQLRKQEENQRL
ncbi:MAG: GntR family transcriptional regulator [Sneathiella sp.]